MNLKDLAKARGTNLKKVAEKCGIPASTLYSISSGETNFDKVGIGLFIKLAEELEVDTDDLYRLNFDDKDSFEKTAASLVRHSTLDELCDEESRLISLYNKMDDGTKKAFIAIAEMFIEDSKHGYIPLITKMKMIEVDGMKVVGVVKD